MQYTPNICEIKTQQPANSSLKHHLPSSSLHILHGPCVCVPPMWEHGPCVSECDTWERESEREREIY